MEGCNVRPFSWWKTSSSSTRLIGFIVPLMVVSAMVVLSSSSSSNWLFASNYYPWTWTSVYPSSGYRSPAANFSKELPPPAQDGGAGLELRRSVVGGGEREEALSVDYSTQRAAAPPLGVQVREAEPPVRILSLIIFLISRYFPFFPFLL